MRTPFLSFRKSTPINALKVSILRTRKKGLVELIQIFNVKLNIEMTIITFMVLHNMIKRKEKKRTGLVFDVGYDSKTALKWVG